MEACRQAWKNRKSYILLSVTIVISFTIIGFYMVYLDSDIYNTHKYIMAESSKVAYVEYEETEEAKIKALKYKLSGMQDTHYYETSEIIGFDILNGLSEDARFVLNVNVIPNEVWGYYGGPGIRVEMSDGNKTLHVEDDEIIISESFDKILNKFKNVKKDGKIDLLYGKQLKVSGVFKDYFDSADYEFEGENKLFHCYAFVSENTAKGLETINKRLIIYSSNVPEIENYAKDLALRFSSFYDDKKTMNEEIIASIEIKKMITVGLMIILGINLMGSFFNAMNDRKFEIAVKRATGAGRGQIIFQFLVEGIVVISLDIIIAIATIISVLELFKFYKFFVNDEIWTINITLYSTSIFLLCCFFLAIFFSVMFSVLTTKVEIIRYIKGE